MTDDTFSEINGRRMVWRDNLGATHYGEGADVHPGIRLLWTKCGARDIPANAAWFKRPEDVVTCPLCNAPRACRSIRAGHHSGAA